MVTLSAISLKSPSKISKKKNIRKMMTTNSEKMTTWKEASARTIQENLLNDDENQIKF